MDDLATHIMRASFIRCLVDATFFKSFYKNFFSISEESKAKFVGVDMSKQAHMLADGITAFLAYAEEGHPNEKIEQLATLHSRRGIDVHPKLYDKFIEAMISTVEQVDPECNDEVRECWRIVMQHGTDFFASKY